MNGFSVEAVRKDFPILDRLVHGDRRLVYLDSANTSQKPRAVLDALAEHYELHNANIHRAQHVLAEEATAAYEGARDKIRDFVGAPAREEIVFTKNASEALNLVANVLGLAPRRTRSVPGPRSSSPRWSTTPTSSRGSCWPSGPAPRCAGSASPTTAGWTCPGWTSWSTSAPGSSPWCWCRTRSAPSTRWPRSPAGRTRSARW